MNTQPEEELLMPKKVCQKCGRKLEPQEEWKVLCWFCDPTKRGEGGSTDYLYDDWSEKDDEE